MKLPTLDVDYMDTSLAVGVGKRMLREIGERINQKTPRHIITAINGLAAKVVKGVPKKKRNKHTDDYYNQQRKCDCVIGLSQNMDDPNLSITYSLCPLANGGIGINAHILDYHLRVYDVRSIPTIAFKSTHVIQRILEREQITTTADVTKVYSVMMDAVITAITEENQNNILDGHLTGKVDVPTSNGGMMLGEIKTDTETGGGILVINSYIDASLVGEHNWARALPTDYSTKVTE